MKDGVSDNMYIYVKLNRKPIIDIFGKVKTVLARNWKNIIQGFKLFDVSKSRRSLQLKKKQ